MKRCPRCQNNYTDDVRWCPADGTPTENIAPISPSALAAAAVADIPEGSPTLRDMPAVGADSPDARDSSPTIPESAGLVAGPQGPLIGATTPDTRTPSIPVASTFMGATSPIQRAPAPPTPLVAQLAAAAAGPQVAKPGAVTAGWDIPEFPASGPTTVPGTPIPPITSSLPNTFMGTTSEPPREPSRSNTVVGAPAPRLPASPTPALSLDAAIGSAAIVGPHIPKPGAVTAGWDIPEMPTTLPGTTAPPIHTTPQHQPGPVSLGWDIPDLPAGSTLTGSVSPAPSLAVPPAVHQPGPVSLGWDIPDLPAGSTLTGGVTPSAPATPQVHQPGPVSLGWDVPDLPAGSTLSGSVTPSAPAPHAHQPGPVSLGWDSPEPPPGSTLTGTVSPSALAQAAAPDPSQRIDRPQSTLPGFAPPAEIMRAIQEQRAKTAALRVPQPLSAPEISPEAYEASIPAVQPSTPPAQQQGTVPSFAPPPPQAQPQAVQQPPPSQQTQPQPYSQQAQPSSPQLEPQASPQQPQQPLVPLPPVLPSSAPANKPPSASILEAPAYPSTPATGTRERSASQTDDALKASRGNRTLWIVLALIGLLVIAGVIIIAVTR